MKLLLLSHCSCNQLWTKKNKVQLVTGWRYSHTSDSSIKCLIQAQMEKTACVVVVTKTRKIDNGHDTHKTCWQTEYINKLLSSLALCLTAQQSLQKSSEFFTKALQSLKTSANLSSFHLLQHQNRVRNCRLMVLHSTFLATSLVESSQSHWNAVKCCGQVLVHVSLGHSHSSSNHRPYSCQSITRDSFSWPSCPQTNDSELVRLTNLHGVMSNTN